MASIPASVAMFWGWPNTIGYFGPLVIGPALGQNPPYTLDNFFSSFPKFFGAPTVLANCVTAVGSAEVTVPNASGVMAGMYLQSPDVAPGSMVVSVSGNVLRLNLDALSTDANATLMVYESPAVPAPIINSYLALAVASLPSLMWGEQWVIAVAWFIAHYCTLWVQSEATDIVTAMQTVMHVEQPGGAIPGTVFTLSQTVASLQSLTLEGKFLSPVGTAPDYTLSGNTITLAVTADSPLTAVWPMSQPAPVSTSPSNAQIAAQGVAQGILASKSVGDVSAGYQTLSALEPWAAWGLTRYGQMLATMAKTVGSGPALVW